MAPEQMLQSRALITPQANMFFIYFQSPRRCLFTGTQYFFDLFFRAAP
jgi:hypothetical protein